MSTKSGSLIFFVYDWERENCPLYNVQLIVVCLFLICFHQVDQRWVERYEFDLKGFSQKQQNLYGKYVTLLLESHRFLCQTLYHLLCRLVEKARHRQLTIDRASASMTQHIFEQQSQLRLSFLEQISQAGMHERDTLRQWRRMIVINTHPRCLSVCLSVSVSVCLSVSLCTCMHVYACA